MVANPVIPVIDYTSRDYEAIRTDMIRLIRSRLPQWTADNPNDFGVALVEAFAYGVDTLHYYLDRIANEAYLTTAVQRESLYSIADMFNYVPRGATPASVDLEFANTTQTEVVMPKGTRVQASISGEGGTTLKNFETVAEVTLPPATANAQSLSPPVGAVEGRTYRDETLGVSNGFVRQQYLLPRTSVLPGSITVTTQLADSTVEWNEIRDINDARPTERVFQVLRLTDGSSMIRFGDDLRGEIPGLHSIVRATYRVGGGTSGNVPASTLTTLIEPVRYGVTVTNPLPASGGLNAESLDSIRINAARSFRSRDRAVTLSDYVAVAESVPGVSRAKAVGNNGSSVTVYVAPEDDGTRQPALSSQLDLDTTNFLESRSMAGVTVQVFGAAFTQIYIDLVANCISTARKTDVEDRVRAALLDFFQYQNVGFDNVITARDLYAAMTGIEGLDYPEIIGLSVSPAPTEVETVILDDVAVNAVPYYDDETSLTIAVNGGI